MIESGGEHPKSSKINKKFSPVNESVTQSCRLISILRPSSETPSSSLSKAVSNSSKTPISLPLSIYQENTKPSPLPPKDDPSSGKMVIVEVQSPVSSAISVSGVSP